MENEKQPINIFEFATSELSQDAFLCWLFTHMKYAKEAPAPGIKIAQEFLSRILMEYFSTKSIKIENYKLIEVYRQHRDIDILLEVEPAKKDSSNIYIIIEDKTLSGESRKNQLEYYVAKLQKNHPDNIIIPVYFQTGYLLPKKKKELERRDLVIIDTYDIQSVMNSHQSYIQEDVILQSWWEYFYKNHYKNVEAIKNLHITEESRLEDFQGLNIKGAFQPLFNEISGRIMNQFTNMWSMKSIEPQGRGQTSLHIMLTKDDWINFEERISASINFILKRNFDFSLVLQIKTEPYKPKSALTANEIAYLKDVQRMFKAYMKQKGLENWKIQNYPIQSASLQNIEDKTLKELEEYVATNIAELEEVVDYSFEQLK